MRKDEKPERDEVALAARASTRKVDGLTRALPAWLEPIIMPDKMSAEEARAELAKGIKVTTPLGEEIILDNRLLNHWQRENKSKEDIDSLLAVLPLIIALAKKDGGRTRHLIPPPYITEILAVPPITGTGQSQFKIHSPLCLAFSAKKSAPRVRFFLMETYGYKSLSFLAFLIMSS